MEKMFLDTNVLVRYLTRDDPDKMERSRRLLARAEGGELALVVSESVVVELVQVLSSRRLYNIARTEVARAVSTIIGLSGVRMADKDALLRALEVWASSSADFVDALIFAQMERQEIDVIASFDRDFDHLAGITRCEP